MSTGSGSLPRWARRADALITYTTAFVDQLEAERELR
jgi:hypothetical protein